MSTPIIAVLGATGAQGGGLARAILADADGEFAVRAITRNPGSEAARAMADRGAEVVQADIDDRASLRDAFDGVHGAFCVTSFWEHVSGAKEREQAGNLAAATAAAEVTHVVWSTFSDTRRWLPLDDDRMPVLQEHYNIPHFDAKGEANADFDAERTTLLLASFYWENFIHFGLGPQRGEDGVLAITMPMGDAGLPGIAVDDIGRCALGVFKAGAEHRGGTVGIAGEILTGGQMAEAMGRAIGEEVRYHDVSADAYRSFGFDGADEMGNMFQFKRDFEDVYAGERDVDLSRRLNPDLQDFQTWLAAHAEQIPVEPAEQ